MFKSLEELIRFDMISVEKKLDKVRKYDVTLGLFLDMLNSGIVNEGDIRLNNPQCNGGDESYVHTLKYEGMTLVLVTEHEIYLTEKKEKFEELLRCPCYN